MSQVKIIILCAAGMSSSLIVNSMREAAEKQGVDIDVHCQPSLNFKDADYSSVNVVLLAPQVRGQAADIKAYLAGYDVAVGDIGMYEYGLVKGDLILKQALSLAKK